MSPDSLVFFSNPDDPVEWRAALTRHLPDLDFKLHTEVTDALSIRYALVWKPPIGFFTPFKNLGLVINLGAGVDSLVSRDDLPDVPITRLTDPNMARMMSSFVQMAVLRHSRDIAKFVRAQRRGVWDYIHPRDPVEVKVGVMGLGELGGRAAADLARHGFQVSGWSRTPKQIDGVTCMAGEAALDDFLAQCQILVCLLPLTPDTAGLLNAQRFAALPKGAAFVNVARGAVVVEADMLAALQSGQIGEATLDVFSVEPLPEGHPLWAMDQVLITPHIASIAPPNSAAAEIAANIRRVRAGEPVAHRVDPRRGY